MTTINLPEELESKVCKWCDIPLKDQPIHAYTHSAGWTIEGLKGNYWVYVVCPKCGHQWSLEHLGISRELTLRLTSIIFER